MILFCIATCILFIIITCYIVFESENTHFMIFTTGLWLGILILAIWIDITIQPKEIITISKNMEIPNIVYNQPKEIVKTEYKYPWYSILKKDSTYIIKDIK